MSKGCFNWEDYGESMELTVSTNPDPSDNAGWTTFFNQGGGANLVFDYAKYYAGEGGIWSPNLEAGNTIYICNGHMSGNMWSWLADKAAQDGGFPVIVPVIEDIKLNQGRVIQGFAYYVIDGVIAHGQEGHTIHGYFRYIENVNAEQAQGQLGLFGIRLSSGALIP